MLMNVEILVQESFQAQNPEGEEAVARAYDEMEKDNFHNVAYYT